MDASLGVVASVQCQHKKTLVAVPHTAHIQMASFSMVSMRSALPVVGVRPRPQVNAAHPAQPCSLRMASFDGLSTSNRLQLHTASVECTLDAPQNGIKARTPNVGIASLTAALAL